MNSLILKETQAMNMLFEEIYEKEETFENLMTFAGIISVLENFLETATSEELIEIIESGLLQMRTRWSLKKISEDVLTKDFFIKRGFEDTEWYFCMLKKEKYQLKLLST